MSKYTSRENKKPKTAPDKGKRYRCCVCRKKSARKVNVVPYYCDLHQHLARRNEGSMT